ncbi:hypothetical protein GC194_04880 [bacterium]|nr:hypothetical protein [bacterium]
MYTGSSVFAEPIKEKGECTMTIKTNPEKPDKESPELSKDIFAQARPIQEADPDLLQTMKRLGGRPRLENPKQHIGMRLDADIVAWLRSHKGYNAIVNDTLRKEMERGPR